MSGHRTNQHVKVLLGPSSTCMHITRPPTNAGLCGFLYECLTMQTFIPPTGLDPKLQTLQQTPNKRQNTNISSPKPPCQGGHKTTTQRITTILARVRPPQLPTTPYCTPLPFLTPAQQNKETNTYQPKRTNHLTPFEPIDVGM